MTELKTFPDSASLADEVGRALVERLGSLQATGVVPSVALTGGTIAVDVYAAAAGADAGSLDWSRVDFWWGDERFVPADSEDRNELAARRALLDVVDVDPARVHPMPASDAGFGDVHQAASAYAEEVRAIGADSGTGEFDLVLLGLGPDGHVASLMPGMPQLDVTDQIAVGVTGSPNPPPERISLTFPALNRTREVWFLVSGDGKADAVARALAEDGSVHETPARGMHSPNTTWWLDRPAASRL